MRAKECGIRDGALVMRTRSISKGGSSMTGKQWLSCIMLSSVAILGGISVSIATESQRQLIKGAKKEGKAQI